jgi:hypothetical protein
MANPIQLAAQTNQNPLVGLTQDAPMTPNLGINVDRTARLAAIATVPSNEILDNYQTLTNLYKQNIQKYGDDEVRTKIATQQQADDFRELNKIISNSDLNFDPTGELRQGARLAADQVVNESIQKRKEYALEKKALDNIQAYAAQGDYTQAHVLMNLVQHGDADRVIQDINLKRMILNREIEKAQVEKDHQGWFGSATDFVMSTLGSLTLNNHFDREHLMDIDKSVEHWYDWLLTGKRERNEASALWQMNPADFAKTLRETVIPRIKQHAGSLGYTNKNQILELLTGLREKDDLQDVHDVFDLAGVATLLPVSKIASLPSAMLRAGARSAAAETLASTSLLSVRSGAKVAEEATGVGTEDVIKETLPSAMNVTGPEHIVANTGDSMAALERGKMLLQRMAEWTKPNSRMTDAELNEAISKEQQRLNIEIGRPLKDFRVVDIPNSVSNTKRFEFLFGKEKGGGFVSEKSARQEAKRAYGITDADVVQAEDGQFFIKDSRDLNESGYYTTNLNPGLKRTGILGRIFLGNRQIDDEILAGQARQAGNTRNRIVNQFYKKYHKTLTGVHGPEKDMLMNAMAWGENNGVWLNKDELDELFARQGATEPPSKAVHEAYQAARDINDMEYKMRNDVEWTRRATKGFETVTLQHPLFQGGVLDRSNALLKRGAGSAPGGGKTRILDLETGIHYHKNNPLTPDRFQDMLDDGYALVSMEDEQKLTDGTTVKHFLAKPGTFEAERLRVDQLPYRAGGHRLYADRYFVKQTVYGTQPDTGEKFLKNPATYISGTKAEVEKWAEVMEGARQFIKDIYRKGGSLAWLEEHLAPITGLKADDVLAMFQDGRLQLDTPFRPMFDRELPEEYLKATTPLDFVDIEETGFTGWLRTNGRMYYSSKGDILHDWQWENAKTVDPFVATNEALNNIANIASFSDYKINAVERWVNTYKEFLDTGGLPNNASDLTIFSEAKYRSNVDKMPMGAGTKIKERMEAQRDIIRRNLGWRTDLDRRVNQYNEDMISFIQGSDPTSIRHSVGNKLTDWWEERNPLNAMRRMAFDMKMGFFNVAQFPLQIQTMLATLALAPEHAVDAMVEIPAMRWYLSRAGNDEGLIPLAKRLGYNEKEASDWARMMQEAKKSGFFEFGGSHQLIHSYGPSAVTGGFADGVDKFSKAGRWFFNEGEVWNRMVAWQVAWREQMQAGLRVGSTDFMRNVSLRADDFSMNMMAQSSAAWQHGILSVPTQFWAYQARMLEAYLGKQFTLAQKMRLFVAQTFFYGAAGAPLVGVPVALWKNQTGEITKLNTPAGFLDRGMIDHVIFNGWGANVLAGKRYGTGTWLADMVGEMFGQSPYGEKSVVEIFGGATVNIATQTLDTLFDVLRHSVAESGAEDYTLTKADLLRLAKNISTFSYTEKAFIAHQYNMYVTNKGNVLANDLPNSDAFFFALGMQPGEQDDVGAWFNYMKNKKQAVDDAAKYITAQRSRMEIETDRRSEIASEINAYVRLLPQDVKIKALKEANRRTPKSIHEGLAQQIERERAQREMLNGQTN